MENTVIVQGRLCADPVIRYTKTSNKPVCSFLLASERNHRKVDGTRETDFVQVVCWGPLAEFVAKEFRKSRKILVRGSLQLSRWTDKEGKIRQKLVVRANSVNFCD